MNGITTRWTLGDNLQNATSMNSAPFYKAHEKSDANPPFR